MRSKAEVDRLLKGLNPQEMADMLVLLDELDERKRVSLAQNDFLAFIAAVDPTYKFGSHLKRLGNLLMGVEIGSHDRIAVSMAPRFGKSQMISIYYPAWYLGKHPDHKVIVASHTADLAVDMARKVRNLMQTDEYRRIFPGVAIAADAKAAGKWNTNKGGEYYATGVGGALAGRGGHLIIIDDPHSEQDIKNGNTESFETTYEWFRSGLRTRLMPGGKLCVLHTRWTARDLIGRLVKDGALNEDGDQYEVFEFPAILNEGTEDEKSLWPEQWSLESLLRTKASMSSWQWNAQYQQSPTARDAAIIKRDWIQWWPKEDPPPCDFIVQAWDTALTTKERSDYSVCQTWGVFTNEEDGDATHVVLLNCVRGKWEFPDLKQVAHEQAEYWQPDSIIIEAKASGQPLIDELRRSGLLVQEFSPGKGQDKIARLNAVSDMFAGYQVWFPETRWATEVVEELLAFPSGEHDDQCFVANTKITMFDGRDCDILDVREGDLVWTPTGPHRVIAAACSNPSALVVEVSFSDGSTLRGTANHPIYVPTAQAFIPLGNLQHGDFVCTSKHFSTKELTTVGTLIVRTPPFGATFTVSETVKMKRFIGVFGKMLTALYQMASTSTTRIMTRATTAWTTLSALVRRSMGLNTAQMTPAPAPCTNASGHGQIVNLSVNSQQRTPAPTAARHLPLSKQTAQSFALRVATTCSTAADLLTPYVSSATRSSKRLMEKLRALTHAKRSETVAVKPSGTLDDTPPDPRKSTSTPVPSAALSTLQTDLSASYVPRVAKKQESYGCSVKDVRVLPNRESVYALQVEGNPVFYANGVLVHNCDTLTLALRRVRTGGLLRLSNDQDSQNDYMPRRKAAYY